MTKAHNSRSLAALGSARPQLATLASLAFVSFAALSPRRTKKNP